MIKGRRFLFQSAAGTVYYVTEAGVEIVWSLVSRPDPITDSITAFIDGDKGNCQPMGFLLRKSVQLIVAASPKGVKQSWVKQTGDLSFVSKFVVKLWSRKELILAGLVLALLSTLN
jgi:hypothetical protein